MRGIAVATTPLIFSRIFYIPYYGKEMISVIKVYYADVASGMVEYFESKLKEKGVKFFLRETRFNSNNELYYHYLVACKEGIINPEYELEL